MMVPERRRCVGQVVIERGLEVIASMQRGCGKTATNGKVEIKLSWGKRVVKIKEVFILVRKPSDVLAT